MNTNTSNLSASFISNLRNLAQQNTLAQEEEHCDFCGETIPEDHRHFMDIETNDFFCSCEICAVKQAVEGNFKPVPTKKLYLKDFKMPKEVWADFMIPVNMAFFVNSTRNNGIVSYYPAPTGATESKLKMEPWKKLEELNPLLKKMNPDVEALLLNRLDEKGEYFLVPIDTCYKLIGTIRSSWKGLFGGKEVDNTIRNFFKDLKKESTNA